MLLLPGVQANEWVSGGAPLRGADHIYSLKTHVFCINRLTWHTSRHRKAPAFPLSFVFPFCTLQLKSEPLCLVKKKRKKTLVIKTKAVVCFNFKTMKKQFLIQPLTGAFPSGKKKEHHSLDFIQISSELTTKVLL